MESLLDKTIRTAMDLGMKLLSHPTVGKLASNPRVLDVVGKAFITASRVKERVGQASPVIVQTLGTLPLVGTLAERLCNNKENNKEKDSE